MLFHTTPADMRHCLHVVFFQESRTAGGRSAPVPVGKLECISANTEMVVTTQELFASLSDHQLGPKVGAAIVPAHFDYGPDGACRRLKDAVTGGPAFIVLDSDHTPTADFERLKNFLQKAKIDALMYSTHSSGKDDGQVSFRLVVMVNRPHVNAQEISQARKGLMAWLVDMLDVSPKMFDAQCTDPARLFFLPRHDAQRAQHAFAVRSVGRALDLDVLLAYVAASKEAAKLERAEPRALADWPLDVRNAALDGLARLASDIAASPGDSLRQNVLVKRCPIIGGYVGSGLLTEDEVEKTLLRALEERARRFPGQDDQTVDDRLDTAWGLVVWGCNKPVVPYGFTPAGMLDETKPVRRRSDRFRQAVDTLLNEPETNLVSLTDARKVLGLMLREPPPEHGVRTDLIRVTTAAGKTWTLIDVALERQAVGLHTVVFSNDHGLLKQMRDDATKRGGKTWHYYGAEAPKEKTDGAQCERLAAGEEALVQLKKAGGRIARTVCPSCPLRKTCVALKNSERSPWDEGAFIIFAPYAAIHAYERWELPWDTKVFFDEQPPGPEQIVIYAKDLEGLGDSMVWLKTGQNMRDGLLRFASDLLNDSEPEEKLLKSLSKYAGAPDLLNWGAEAQRRYSSELGIIKSLLQAALALHEDPNALVAVDDERWVCWTPAPCYAFMQEHNVTVLSATPDMSFYKGLNVWERSCDVEDWHTTPRVMLFRGASRATMCPGGAVRPEVVERYLKEALQLCKPTMRILVATYKCVADALNGPLKSLTRGYTLEVRHHEILRGRDDWKDFDACITLGDPIKPPKVGLDGKPEWDDSHEHARDALTQSQSRLRDAQPRPSYGLHIHVGTVVPRFWGAHNAVLVASKTGATQLTTEHREAMRALQVELGQEAAARKLGVSAKTFRAWLNGHQGRGGKLAQAIATLDELIAVDRSTDVVNTTRTTSEVSNVRDGRLVRSGSVRSGVRGEQHHDSAAGERPQAPAADQALRSQPRAGPSVRPHPGRQRDVQEDFRQRTLN